jgi:hypothetical protein
MKQVYTIILFIFIAEICTAQEIKDDALFSLRAGLGYGFPVAGGNLATSTDNGSITGIYGSWGKGFVPSLDFSARVYRNTDLLIGVNTLFGATVKSTNMSSGEITSFDQTTKSHLMIPALVTIGGRYNIHWWECQDNSEDNYCTRFVPYAGFGLGVAFGSTVKTTVNSVSTNLSGNLSTTTDIKSTTTFMPALDLYGDLGVKFLISDNFSIFAGLRLSSMSLMPVKQVINSEVVNGQDITSSLTVYEKEIDYKKHVTSSGSNQDEPSQQLAEKIPASTLAVNCGIAYNFGSHGTTLSGGTGHRHAKGGPKPQGGGNTKEKGKGNGIKEKAADICTDCPPPTVTLVTNNDGKNFPKDSILRTKGKPWGKTELLDLDTLDHEAVCEPCGNVNPGCCCRLKRLTIKVSFLISIDTADIRKGVWMNTKDSLDQKDKKGKRKPNPLFGHTKTGKDAPEGITKDLGDWKKVDSASVLTHERRHCRDMTDSVKIWIDKLLKFLPSETCNCKSKDDYKICKKMMDKECGILKKLLNDLVLNEMKNLSNDEKKDYGEGKMEKNARKIQAEELNKRQ